MEYDKRNDRNDEVFSKAIKAGKRTYFFDIKTTKGNELYLTLTESKKVFEDGREYFQKHKIFLYKEDFEKFREGLDDVLAKIDELRLSGDTNSSFESIFNASKTDENDIRFEDL